MNKDADYSRRHSFNMEEDEDEEENVLKESQKPRKTLSVLHEKMYTKIPALMSHSLKGKTKVVLISWSVFLVTWMFTALLLTLIEDQSEHDDLKSFRKDWKSLYNAQNTNTKDMIDDFFQVMGSNCHIPTVSDETWDFVGSVFFTLNLATTIGYGTFSVNTNNGKLVTILYSFFAIPLFMYCLSSMTNVWEHLIGLLPFVPQGDSTKARCRRMFVRPAIFVVMFLFWIGIGGGFVLPVLTKQDWTPFEGMYFGYITATTIGLGDYAYDIDQSKGAVVIWVLVSLSLFHAFVSNINRVINILMLDFSVPRDSQEVLTTFDDDELIVIATTFMVVDLDGNGVIDCKELRYMLSLVGLDVDSVLEHKIDELMYLYDVDMSDTVDTDEWYLIASPLMTKAGQKREQILQARDFILAFLFIVCSLLFGGFMFNIIEYDNENNNLKKWETMLDNHYTTLNTTQQETLTDIFGYLVRNGGCSIPTCKEYDAGYHGTDNMFFCKDYVHNWDFSSAVFFSFTLFTTIGYGSYSPQTSIGKLFTCFFSCYGVILTSFFVFALLDIRSLMKRLLFPKKTAGLSVNLGGGGRYGGGRKARVQVKDGGTNDEIVQMIKETGVGNHDDDDDDNSGKSIFRSIKKRFTKRLTGFENKIHRMSGGNINIRLSSDDKYKLKLDKIKKDKEDKEQEENEISKLSHHIDRIDEFEKARKETLKAERKIKIKHMHITFPDLPPLPKEIVHEHEMAIHLQQGGGTMRKKTTRRQNIAHPKALDKPDHALGLVGASDLVSPPKLPTSFDPYTVKTFMLAFVYLIFMGLLLKYEIEETWNFKDSFYFMWISCTAIGLGDFAPSDENEILLMIIITFGLSFFIGMFVFMEGYISHLFKSHITIPPSVRFGNAINEAKNENPDMLKRAHEEIRQKRELDKQLQEERLNKIQPTSLFGSFKHHHSPSFNSSPTNKSKNNNDSNSSTNNNDDDDDSNNEDIESQNNKKIDVEESVDVNIELASLHQTELTITADSSISRTEKMQSENNQSNKLKTTRDSFVVKKGGGKVKVDNLSKVSNFKNEGSAI